jgi:hypothetical protein
LEGGIMGMADDLRRDSYFKNMRQMSKTILSLVETMDAARVENNMLKLKCHQLEEALKKKKNA